MIEILLTNDDGIEAPGMLALVRSVVTAVANLEISAKVWVVAPDRGRSECGHSVTNGRPMTIVRRDDLFDRSIQAFSVDGTPVDCIRAAKFGLINHVEVVFSGVNAGANVGVDLMVSGTFAAAREAASQSIPAMSLSHYRHPSVPKTWEHVPRWTAGIVGEFINNHVVPRFSRGPRDPAKIALHNVNLPAVNPSEGSIPDIVECDVDQTPVPRIGTLVDDQLTYELDFHGRPRVRGQDVDRCFEGKITVSRLSAIAGA